MVKRGIITILLILSLISVVSAQDYTVTREIDVSSVETTGQLSVTLTIDVGDSPKADAFVIDEVLPTGWTVEDANGGSTLHTGHLKWVVCGHTSGNPGYDCSELDCCVTTIEDMEYTYILNAPNSAETSTFSGTYLFDQPTNANVATIGGDSTITVVEPVPTTCDGHSDSTGCNADANCAWCGLDNGGDCKTVEAVECTTLGCIDGASLCRDTCAITQCGTNRFCNMTADVCQDAPTSTNTTPTCTEDWDCSGWSPTDCPDSRTQTQTCSDSNSCGTELNKPALTQTCRPPRGSGGSGGSTGTGDVSPITTPRGTRDSTTDTGTGETTGRGSRGSTTDTGATGGRDTSTNPSGTDDDPKTPAEELESKEKENNNLYYLLLILLVLIGGGLIFYFKQSKVNMNNSLTDQTKRLQEQQAQMNNNVNNNNRMNPPGQMGGAI